MSEEKAKLDISVQMISHLAEHSGLAKMEGTIGETDPKTGLMALNIGSVSMDFNVAALGKYFTELRSTVEQAALPDGYTAEDAKTALDDALKSIEAIKAAGTEQISIQDRKGVFLQLSELAPKA